MIDLHSHILPFIDDGAKSLEESIKLAISAEKMGITGIACSSHFIYGKYTNKNYEKKFIKLNKELKKKKIKIKLYRANEIMLIDENIEELKKKKINTYNNTNYILIELKLSSIFKYINERIKIIQELGYIVVLAHIERYGMLTMKELIKLKEMGVIFQLNMNSIKNRYKKIAKKYLKYNLIDIIATDTHRAIGRNYELKEAIKSLKKILGEKKFNELIIINPTKIINGENFKRWEKKYEKKNICVKFIDKFINIFR
ncbi:MAG: tyrosine-protein phosphatase [Fusobacteriaceae bacterium]